MNNLSGRNYLLTKISAQRKKLKFYIEVEKGGRDDKAPCQDLDDGDQDEILMVVTKIKE